MRQVGVEKNNLIRPQIGRHGVGFFTGKKTDALHLISRHQSFRFGLGAAVVGVQVQQPAALVLLSRDKIFRVAVKRVEQPGLADVFRQSAVIQNRRHDVIAAAMAG